MRSELALIHEAAEAGLRAAFPGIGLLDPEAGRVTIANSKGFRSAFDVCAGEYPRCRVCHKCGARYEVWSERHGVLLYLHKSCAKRAAGVPA